MQLFITEFEKKGGSIKISNPEILAQIRKVLRMKIGDEFFVQNENIRHKLQITDRDNKNIFGNIIDSIEYSESIDNNGIAIAMSNKRDKMETIVQKLSEIGIKHIYFRPSERSIIREWNEKKLERINKIAKEAVEQSRGRFLPEIKFEKDVAKIIEGKNIIIFDKCESQVTKNLNFTKSKQAILGIVGPEGGLTDNDYKIFGDNKRTVSLGDTVLRTETASIIAAWTIKNIYFN